jgi:N-acetylglucosamine malate deacetylase 1
MNIHITHPDVWHPRRSREREVRATIHARTPASVLFAIVALAFFLVCLAAVTPEASAASGDRPLRIIVFAAHPDDAEFNAGGVAALWVARGHKVKFVSMTNGDLGHYEMGGGPLARRRKAEVERAAKTLGIETHVMDIHDGELMPTLENRKAMVRLIREWRADIVISHRPYDYNPDHRYVGVLAQDSAFMVTVPFYDLHSEPRDPNPVFLFLADRFMRPIPFRGDIVVGIDEVFQKKVDAVDALASQVYETIYGVDPETRRKRLAAIPKDPVARRVVAEKKMADRGIGLANRFRQQLTQRYGAAGQDFKYAEAFEVCEYGRQPTEAEIRALFPFFPASTAGRKP